TPPPSRKKRACSHPPTASLQRATPTPPHCLKNTVPGLWSILQQQYRPRNESPPRSSLSQSVRPAFPFREDPIGAATAPERSPFGRAIDCQPQPRRARSAAKSKRCENRCSRLRLSPKSSPKKYAPGSEIPSQCRMWIASFLWHRLFVSKGASCSRTKI